MRNVRIDFLCKLPFWAQKLVNEDESDINGHFGGDVTLSFDDGSRCLFKNAFYVSDGEVVAILTEHCGYHAFPCGEEGDEISGEGYDVCNNCGHRLASDGMCDHCEAGNPELTAT